MVNPARVAARNRSARLLSSPPFLLRTLSCTPACGHVESPLFLSPQSIEPRRSVLRIFVLSSSIAQLSSLAPRPLCVSIHKTHSTNLLRLPHFKGNACP